MRWGGVRRGEGGGGGGGGRGDTGKLEGGGVRQRRGFEGKKIRRRRRGRTWRGRADDEEGMGVGQ